ncbi:50S ribosomal protein L18 [Patescibacteria group bacterium]|nr:50S ribosomal protein L18 [Patescibacteria group bacterium]
MLKEVNIRSKNVKLRKNRTRKKIISNSGVPRLSAFRSLKHFYLQIIDDAQGKTLCTASDKEVEKKGKKPVEIAMEVGREIAKKAKQIKLERVVFDRGSYRYHGRVKAAAEGAREEGLKF